VTFNLHAFVGIVHPGFSHDGLAYRSKCQVFRIRVNVPTASITSNFDTNRGFLRREGAHPDVNFRGIGLKISVLFARYAFTRVHLYWPVRVPQMPGVQIPCKCPISEQHIKFRHLPHVPKARREPSRCVLLRNWPENSVVQSIF